MGAILQQGVKTETSQPAEPHSASVIWSIEVVKNGVDKLKRSGFGSIPAGYHETCETEKEHEWYAFST